MEFMSRKIEDLNGMIGENNKQYEERISKYLFWWFGLVINEAGAQGKGQII